MDDAFNRRRFITAAGAFLSLNGKMSPFSSEFDTFQRHQTRRRQLFLAQVEPGAGNRGTQRAEDAVSQHQRISSALQQHTIRTGSRTEGV